jgi:hypothetical protein
LHSTLNYELSVPADITIQNEAFEEKQASILLLFTEKQKVS